MTSIAAQIETHAQKDTSTPATVAALIHDKLLQSLGVAVLGVDLGRRLHQRMRYEQALAEMTGIVDALELALASSEQIVPVLQQMLPCRSTVTARPSLRVMSTKQLAHGDRPSAGPTRSSPRCPPVSCRRAAAATSTMPASARRPCAIWSCCFSGSSSCQRRSARSWASCAKCRLRPSCRSRASCPGRAPPDAPGQSAPQPRRSPPPPTLSPVLYLDFEMLVTVGGIQRTDDEYRGLSAKARFHLTSVAPLNDAADNASRAVTFRRRTVWPAGRSAGRAYGRVP